jgi:hypothetical protein
MMPARCKALASCHHQFIETKANHTYRIYSLARPCVANLLYWPIRKLLFSISAMHNVITSVHSVIDGLLQLFLVSPKPLGNLLPRIVESQERSGDVDATFSAQISEIHEANHLHCYEQRIGIGEKSQALIKVEREAFELLGYSRGAIERPHLRVSLCYPE